MVDVQLLLSKIEQATVLGFDVEYTGPTIKLPGGKPKPDPYRAKLHGFAVAYLLPGQRKPGSTYIPVNHSLPEDTNVGAFDVGLILDAVLSAAERGKRVWAHNAAAELQTLINEEEILEGTHCPFSDSMVAAWLLGNLDEEGNEKSKADDKLALKSLRVKLLGKPERPDFKAITKGAPLETVALDVVAPYCRYDAVDCLELGEYALKRLAPELVRHMDTIDVKCIEPIRAMEAAGMAIDVAALETSRTEWSARCDHLRAEFTRLTTTNIVSPTKVKVADGVFKNGNVRYRTEIQDLVQTAGANVSSSEQISKWCYDVLEAWPTTGLKRNKKGCFPTDKEVLLPFTKLPGLGGELARIRLEFNKFDKLVSTYARPMMAAPSQYADGRLHCRFKLTGTDTQRLSSSGPNLQNLPSRSAEGKAIRKAVVAPSGRKIVVADANQAELRIAAHLSQDPELMLCYELEEDIHAGTLAMMQHIDPSFQRTDAKVVNFCLVPETPVLTAALQWVQAGDVQPGALLVGFDERLGRSCRYRTAEVLNVTRFRAECFEIVTDRGTVVCSGDHGWVADKWFGRRDPTIPNGGWRGWVKARDLCPGQRLAHMVDPWQPDESRDAGWLAGFFDGEGFVGTGGTVGFGQNRGPTRDRALALLEARCFTLTQNQNTTNECCQSLIRGYGENLRLVGQIRPTRLLAKPERLWLGKRPYGPLTKTVTVVSVRSVGIREVVGHTTTTGTMIAGGFLTHNSSLYNITAERLAGPGKMNCSTDRAQQALDAFYARFARIAPFQERCYNFIIEHGYMETVDGYRRPINGRVVYDRILKRRALHWKSRNRGPNTAIQGSVAGIMKIALIRLYDEWRAKDRWGFGPMQAVIIAQEHDSLVAEAGADMAEVVAADMVRHIETAFPLSVPFKADFKIGNSWAECK